MPDDIPTLADLRRTRTRRATTPSLFDNLPTPNPPPSAPPREASSPSAQDPAQDPEVLSVAELVRRIRSLVERTHGRVTVEGEISNWRPAASGHCYFTLKDGDAQLSIVLFRRQAQLLRFKPKDGDAVRLSGQLSVYESRGQLQLIAETMQPVGIGALLAAVQALKEKLRREGIFANQRPLPAFPRCIGIVTSLRGAALRDIVKVCRRRHAAVNLLIYPAAVQGPNCAREVAAGVRWFSSHPDKADVILIARGGGSWEDLHGFDDESLCRAIAASTLPVLTGIGHATDSVLADSAADLCAPTPSAAAELVTAAQHNIADRVQRLHQRLLRANRYELLRTRQRLSGLSADSILARTRNTLERRAQRLDDLTDRNETALQRNLRARSSRLLHLDTRLQQHHPNLRLANIRHRLASLHHRLTTAQIPPQSTKTRLAHLTTKLETLSPLRVLDRGYALVYGPNGNLLRDPTEAPPNTPITAQLAKGRLRARVISSEWLTGASGSIELERSFQPKEDASTMRKLFGTDGIRAIAGVAPLDKRTIRAIGVALARHLGNQPRLILGMDTRESGPWILETLAAALTGAGATVESAGIITTPAIAYLARKHGFSAGIVISASHNPWQDNGIKIFGGDGYKLPDDTELAIEAEIEAQLARSTEEPANPYTLNPEPSPLEPSDAYRAEYVRFLLDAVPNLSLDNRTVVIDCANGAASSIAPQLFANLGGTVEVTHASPNGRNINANCGALHPEIVAAEVTARHASMGFTFDGDADRALFADEHGNIVNGDAVMLACARDLQSRGELANNLVVATTMSNMGLEAAFTRSGIQMLRAPVGDKYVLEEMRRSGASLGGEQSGHILFPARATTGDGLLTALIVLDVVHRSGKTLGQLIADLKNYPQVILNVKVREKVPLDTLPTVAAAIAAAEEALATTGRVVIRYSGTEALARVMIEAESEAAMRHHAEAIANAIRTELGI